MATVFAVGPSDAQFVIDVTGDVVTMSLDTVQVLGEQGAAVADTSVTATLTAVDTGTDMTAAQAATIVTDITDLSTQLNALLAALRTHGTIAT